MHWHQQLLNGMAVVTETLSLLLAEDSRTTLLRYSDFVSLWHLDITGYSVHRHFVNLSSGEQGT